MNTLVSDETLHAFVDGELDVADREALVARMQSDPELARRICAVRSLRDMMKLAYSEPPAARTGETAVRTRFFLVQRCAFGCLVLFAGLIVGWVLRGVDAGTGAATEPVTRAAALQPVSLARVSDPNRVMLHLDNAAPDRMLAVLNEAERLLDEADRQDRIMQIEVIANSHGLKLLRAGHSPYADRIARMQQRHANLNWVACSQSIARFTSEGQKIELLPAARTAPTAIGEIITRLQQGWTYVRV
jgi:intracellular sulfur oxidation DsrE/DsrF family protein